MNSLFRSQIKLLKLDVVSQSYKDLGEVVIGSINDLTKKQTELVTIYTDAIASSFEKLNNATKVDDLGWIASDTSKLKEAVQENLTNTAAVITSIQSGLEAVAESVLDGLAKEEPAKE